ncbi:zinc knuckle-domain-containing protein [Mycena metata]|uniref:Zinc knuckle-domain-containing protein n=1 Tax=Mycena metata TaxID=1033252 RepID=A0AAD7KGA6_9AGAR|nr:zinc knuckle-domain-containing protein [Mycena metata]
MSKYAPHRQSNRPRANPSTVCQKCLRTGHFIYECKSERPYVSRPSRSQQLEKGPGVLAKLKASGQPSVEVPEEFKKKDGTANRILEQKAKEREKGKERESKKARRSSSPSDSGSDSDSSSSSGSSSDSGSGSDSGRSRERKRRVPTKRDRSRSKSP